jgi:hypothetical protein
MRKSTDDYDGDDDVRKACDESENVCFNAIIMVSAARAFSF